LNPAVPFWRTTQGTSVLLILQATLGFAVMDTTVKYSAALVPLLMLLSLRYILQTVLTLAWRFPLQRRQLFVTANPRFQLLRGTLLLTSSTCMFFALRHLPVGEFTAMAALTPLVATAMSAWAFKHRVTPAHWLLLLFGLVGVVLVAHPNGQVFSWALVFPLLLIFSNAGFQVLSSHMSGAEDPYTTHFYTGLMGSLITAPLLFFVWDTAALLQYWYLFIAVALMGNFGHLKLIRAYRQAPALALMPYLYSQIAFATVCGILVFGHLPDQAAIVGIVIIAVSGVCNALLSQYEAKKKGVLA
jgi:drug/metabolite transporter (DMT)-like permease